MYSLRGTVLLSLLAVPSEAWIESVHNQIGFLAERFLEPRTAEVIREILEPEYEGSIGQAAAWPDAYKQTDEGRYTGVWHYIDAADNPPAYCNVYYDRDCSEAGCVVYAIANQTVRLASCVREALEGPPEDIVSCSRALKFITHFLGDIANPLHATGLGRRGMDFPVRFNGEHTDLHVVWDAHIIFAAANSTGFSSTSIDPFFETLETRIREDRFPIPTRSWLQCTDPSTPIACAMSWIRDSSEWNCDYAFSQEFTDGDLIENGYATGAFPIVELQASKAALRLATWLNNIVADEGDLDRDIVLQPHPRWQRGNNPVDPPPSSGTRISRFWSSTHGSSLAFGSKMCFVTFWGSLILILTSNLLLLHP